MKHVLIVGASRGIGLEFVRQYRAAGAIVTATARSDEGLHRLEGLGARALRLDVADPAGATALAWPIDGEAFDTVVLVAGVYGPRSAGLDAPAEAEFDAVMHTNVLGVMRVLPQVCDGAGLVHSRVRTMLPHVTDHALQADCGRSVKSHATARESKTKQKILKQIMYKYILT